jgi:hypothetical protein
MNPVVAVQPFEYAEMVIKNTFMEYAVTQCSISVTFSAQFTLHNVITLYAI